MARQPRTDVAGEIFHVINRANARQRIFETQQDYRAALKALLETLEAKPIDIFAYILMPNHWHFAVRPRRNGDMGIFFGKFTQKVTQRWHAAHHTTGLGHLFQGRFKSFLVGGESYFLQLMKYIEANALRAGLVGRAEDWLWGSLYVRMNYASFGEKILAAWPTEVPKDYVEDVNRPLPADRLRAIQDSVTRGRPFGDASWANAVIEKYGLLHTSRSPGRPKKG